MRALAIKLNLLACVALALAVAAPVSAATITFGDTSALVSSITDSGYEIAGADGSGTFFILATGDCSPSCADNGTHYGSTFTTGGTATSIAIQASDGSEFSFLGFDGAESPLNDADPSSWASGIRVNFLTAGGLTGFEDFALDQTNDGTGGVADFQSFVSSSGGLLFVQLIFSGLAGNGLDFGIDNVVLAAPGGPAVPEPTTLVLLGSSLAIAGVRRRLKKRG